MVMISQQIVKENNISIFVLLDSHHYLQKQCQRMFLGQQSSKNNVKESCVPYVCFAGRHTLKNKCEEQPYVAVQFII